MASLIEQGYEARHIAQEHSGVPDMWKRIAKPDILIYLDVSYPQTIMRRHLDWTQIEYDEQLYRLRHARKNANLYIHTDSLNPGQVLQIVLDYLTKNS